MADDPIAARYAEALFDAAKAEQQVVETLEQFVLIGKLLRDHPELRGLLFNPDVDPDQKVGVLDRVLAGSWLELVRSFFHMVVALGRSELLPDMVQAFQAAVDRERGELRVTVRSAHPLPEAVLGRLRTRLAHRERKRIHLKTELAPELIGGCKSSWTTASLMALFVDN